MMNSKIKGLAFCSVVALFTAGQAMAHTGIRDKPLTAGVASYNGFTITHGCADYANSAAGTPGGQAYPVLGQAALFPYGANAVWREVAVAPETVGTIISGSTIVAGTYNLGATAYTNVGSAFSTSAKIVDSLGNVHGIVWKDGAMEPKLNTVTPFKITPPAIIDNCIAAVSTRVGVINFCDVQKTAANDAIGPYVAPKDFLGRAVTNSAPLGNIQINTTATTPKFVGITKGNGDHNRADWWFKDLSPASANWNDNAITSEAGLWSASVDVINPNAYSATDLPAVGRVGQAGYQAAVIANPTALAACPGGKTRKVTVEPSGTDFDTYLTAANLQPFVGKYATTGF